MTQIQNETRRQITKVCENCKSPQSALRSKLLGGGQVELSYQCPQCKHREVVGLTTTVLRKLERDRRRVLDDIPRLKPASPEQANLRKLLTSLDQRIERERFLAGLS